MALMPYDFSDDVGQWTFFFQTNLQEQGNRQSELAIRHGWKLPE